VRRVEATFAPVSGQLLGTRPTEEFGLAAPLLLRTLYEFHRNVLLGNAGSEHCRHCRFPATHLGRHGAGGRFPRSRAGWERLVHVNLRASATRINYDLHRSVGVIFVTLLLLATLTGSTLVYLNYVRDLVNRVLTGEVVPDRAVQSGPKVRLGPVRERHRASSQRLPAADDH